MTGTPETRLVFLRGNSGSGKSTVARELQLRQGRGRVAVVAQDVVRREVLWARDAPGNPAIRLMDLMVRFALDEGLSVVVEGILHPDRYGEMLTRLAHDHRGRTLAYFWDLPFQETLRRHQTKPKASEFGESELREWWYGAALVAGLGERVIGADASVDSVVARIRADGGWSFA